MARKIIAVTGANGISQAQYVADWYAERPERRRIARTPEDIKRAVAGDKAVIIQTSDEGATIESIARLALQLSVPLKVVNL